MNNPANEHHELNEDHVKQITSLQKRLRQTLTDYVWDWSGSYAESQDVVQVVYLCRELEKLGQQDTWEQALDYLDSRSWNKSRQEFLFDVAMLTDYLLR
ncbi:MAG: hypothetical protein KKF46_03785 [Nanoarchaeota archaeon]|nr:hypothetical protein [Nanoarchaeota archaeon]MBU1321455.1 hypothetical protein [Nanoarchaeota archaeon]MBU1596911.1 hypothetical protein [Nanoarchaeota archaeon]MBU2441552.1 hypothetical protein [Nanoarchaeota archaeon]